MSQIKFDAMRTHFHFHLLGAARLLPHATAAVRRYASDRPDEARARPASLNFRA